MDSINWHYVAYFFGGAFLTNVIPHTVKGLCGEAFQSPFATPPGRGLSSSRLNVTWGAINAVIGYLLVFRVGLFDIRNTYHALAFGAGSLLLSYQAATHFGKIHGGDLSKRE